MKSGTIRHPKMRALAEALGIPLAQAVGHLHALWEFTAEYAPDGDLSRWPESVICEFSLWKNLWKKGKNPPPHENHENQQFIETLIEVHWLDRLEDGRLVVHDWSEHCEDWVHHRLYRKKATFWDGHKPYKGRQMSQFEFRRSKKRLGG